MCFCYYNNIINFSIININLYYLAYIYKLFGIIKSFINKKVDKFGLFKVIIIIVIAIIIIIYS